MPNVIVNTLTVLFNLNNHDTHERCPKIKIIRSPVSISEYFLYHLPVLALRSCIPETVFGKLQERNPPCSLSFPSCNSGNPDRHAISKLKASESVWRPFSTFRFLQDIIAFNNVSNSSDLFRFVTSLHLVPKGIVDRS